VKPTDAPADVLDALSVVLRAGRPGRFRLLAVVCPQDHIVARVWQTSLGPVLVGEGPGVKAERTLTADDVPGFVSVPYEVEGPRAERFACLLDEWSQVPAAQCRCSTAHLRPGVLLAAIADGQRRIRVNRRGLCVS
jgi:hypothetical protein